MAKVEIYTTMFCPYCHRAKRLLAGTGATTRRSMSWRMARKRQEMIDRAGGRRTCRRSSSTAIMSAAATNSMRWTAPASWRRCCSRVMSARLQGRLHPAQRRARYRAEHRRGQRADPRGQGARRAIHPDAGEHRHDRAEAAAACWRRPSRRPSIRPCLPSGARRRARRLAADRLAADQAGRRPPAPTARFLFDAQGPHRRALRQDPHVRRRPGERRELSRVRDLPAGRARGGRRSALGQARPHRLLRSALRAISTAPWPRPAPAS